MAIEYIDKFRKYKSLEDIKFLIRDLPIIESTGCQTTTVAEQLNLDLNLTIMSPNIKYIRTSGEFSNCVSLRFHRDYKLMLSLMLLDLKLKLGDKVTSIPYLVELSKDFSEWSEKIQKINESILTKMRGNPHYQLFDSMKFIVNNLDSEITELSEILVECIGYLTNMKLSLDEFNSKFIDDKFVSALKFSCKTIKFTIPDNNFGDVNVGSSNVVEPLYYVLGAQAKYSSTDMKEDFLILDLDSVIDELCETSDLRNLCVSCSVYLYSHGLTAASTDRVYNMILGEMISETFGEDKGKISNLLEV